MMILVGDRNQFFERLNVWAGMLALLTGLTVPMPVLADDEMEMAALMALLDSETQVATRTRMNADFVPGMVSVIHGDELKKLGARNGAEALNLIAGTYVTEGNRGEYRVQARGVGASLAGSNIKILLNGLPMNSATSGTADAVLRIPIEQLQRVEVIRGPGSALYGEFAMTGVVNFITRNDSNTVGVRVGSDDYRQADVMTSGRNSAGVAWQANVSGWGRNETGRQSGPDNFTRNGFGHAPGAVDDDYAGNMLLAAVEYDGYRLSTQFLDVERGDYFGRNALADIDPQRARETLTGLAFDKTWQMTDAVTTTLSLNTLHTEFNDSATLTIPEGVDPPGPRPPIAEDRYRINGNSSQQYRADLQFDAKLTNAHTLLWGAGYTDMKIEESSGRIFVPDGEVNTFAATQTLVLEGSNRTIASAYLQDQWRVTRSVEVTLGARYDRYDDWGDNLAPRLAAVWQPLDAHIVKFQYAQSFRPPTLEETYPGPHAFPGGDTTSDVTAEELTSTELAYIFRHSGRIFRATVFKTDIENLIEFFQNPGRPPEYRNRGEINSWGGELEWEQYFGREWKLVANASYVDAEDLMLDNTLVGTVHWLGNASLSWTMSPDINLTGRLRYVGEQEGWSDRINGNQQATFDAYTTLDMVVSWSNVLGVRGLELQAGTNNLLDEAYEILPNPAQYPNGLTEEGRTIWVSTGYRFGTR